MLEVMVSGRAIALQVIETATFPVSPSNINSFATPIAFYQGSIYVVGVEPPLRSNNGVNLRTVIRKGSERDGRWQWEASVIDESTLDDIYHTQASIAIDKAGYVHVAYNMHHMPWQYAVSKRPGDITAFDFKGDKVSFHDKATVKHLNKTPFPSIGTAAIPGNQITYPAFFYDRQGDLYLTYRFATRPRKSFWDRGFAYGLARYDVPSKRWTALGAPIRVTPADAVLPGGVSETMINAFILAEGWQPQLLRLSFDRNNRMHLSWTWRESYGDSPFVRPSYGYSRDNDSMFYRADGTKYSLPLRFKDSGLVIPDRPDTPLGSPLAFVSVDPNGTPYVVTMEKGKPSQVRHYRWDVNEWSDGDPTPGGAQMIEIDDSDRQWAFATGLDIFMRDETTVKWTKIYDDPSQLRFGYFKVLHLHNKNQFLVYAQSVDGKSAKVYDIRY